MTVENLSKHEIVVAKMAVNGLTNDEIAGLLGIVSPTVKVHFRSIFKKLVIERRTELLKFFAPQRQYRVGTVEKEALTVYDRNLLDEMASGLTDAEIARQRRLTNSSVHADVARLRNLLNFRSRNELTMWWIVESGKVKQSSEPMDEQQTAVIDRRTEEADLQPA